MQMAQFKNRHAGKNLEFIRGSLHQVIGITSEKLTHAPHLRGFAVYFRVSVGTTFSLRF
jgi:hypothetical protein